RHAPPDRLRHAARFGGSHRDPTGPAVGVPGRYSTLAGRDFGLALTRGIPSPYPTVYSNHSIRAIHRIVTHLRHGLLDMPRNLRESPGSVGILVAVVRKSPGIYPVALRDRPGFVGQSG